MLFPGPTIGIARRVAVGRSLGVASGNGDVELAGTVIISGNGDRTCELCINPTRRVDSFGPFGLEAPVSFWRPGGRRWVANLLRPSPLNVHHSADSCDHNVTMAMGGIDVSESIRQ